MVAMMTKLRTLAEAQCLPVQQNISQTASVLKPLSARGCRHLSNASPIITRILFASDHGAFN